MGKKGEGGGGYVVSGGLLLSTSLSCDSCLSQTIVCNTAARFGLKLDQIGTKWDKSGTFKISAPKCTETDL